MIYLRTSVGVEMRREDLVIAALQGNFGAGRFTQFARVRDFRTRDRAEVRREIEAFFKSRGLSRDNVVLGLAKSDVVLRPLDLPGEVADNLRQVVAYQVQSFEPTDEQKHYYDFVILHRAAPGKKMSLLLAMVKREILDARLALAREIGLRPAAVTVSSAALANLFLVSEPGNGKKNHFLADVCPSGVELVALREGLPFYSVEAAKEESQSWRELILREIDLAAGKIRLGEDESIERILLAGEEAQQVEQELREDPGDVELLSGRVRYTMPLNLRSHLSEGAIALGLAVSGYERRAPIRLNLIPIGQRSRQKGWAYIPTAILGFLILALATGLGVHGIFQARTLSRRLDAEIAALRPKVGQVQALRSEAEALEKRIQFLEGLLRRGDCNLELLRELTTLLPSDTFLTVYMNREGSLQLSGSSNSPPELVAKLERSPLLQNVVQRGTVFRNQQTNKDQFNFEAKVERCGP